MKHSDKSNTLQIILKVPEYTITYNISWNIIYLTIQKCNGK